ncbi:DUF983 domain-containing protein [Hyphomicrobium sp.]|uniref:DUF983 domain-containing protein n=1 Tax=Hyphomicrobium sp. TaxID=82 RepID=UPI002FDDD768
MQQKVPTPSSEPAMSVAVSRGARCKCPACGEGRLFRKFLKVVDTCPACDEPLHHHRADDMPAYIVMSIVGHVVVGLLLWVEFRFGWPVWLHLSLWLPLTVILTLSLLQPVKGTIVALQWGLRMHGFGTSRPPRVSVLPAS